MPDYTALFFQFLTVRAIYNSCVILMAGAVFNLSDCQITELSEISREMSVEYSSLALV